MLTHLSGASQTPTLQDIHLGEVYVHPLRVAFRATRPLSPWTAPPERLGGAGSGPGAAPEAAGGGERRHPEAGGGVPHGGGSYALSRCLCSGHAPPGVAVSDDGPSAVTAGWLTVTAAAQQAAVPRGVVEGWIVNGHLPAVLVDGLRRVCPADLAAVQEQSLAGVILAWRHDRQHVGRRLRSLREAAGLTPRALAEASGVSRDTIVRIETGRYAPYAETVRRLARSLHLEPQQFVSGEPDGELMRSMAETP